MDQAIHFSSAIPQWIWGAAYVVSVGCLLVAISQLALPRRSSRWLTTSVQLALAGMTILVASDIDAIWQAVTSRPPTPWLNVIAVAICGLTLVFFSAQQRWWSTNSPWRRWGAPVTSGLLAALIVLGTVVRYQAYDQIKVIDSERMIRQYVRELVEVPDAIALTDLGRALPLFEFVAVPESDQLGVDDIGDGMAQRVILADESDSLANCHGWVFTGGRYLIRSLLVDAILHDNGYRVVEEPVVDDLIIYRNGDGLPVHTGLVKATGKGGFVLIESKWGGSHTYFHQPLDQVYSTQFAYYRSPRQGHLLHLEPLTGGDPYRNEELPSWLDIPISAE